MRRGKLRFLLVALLVASGLVFTGGEVPAATFQYSLTSDPITPGQAVNEQTYSYTFTPTPGTLAIGNIDLEIPENIVIPVGPFSGTTSKFSVSINGVNLSGEVYGIGVGDYGTKFGVGDTRFRVMKINTPSLTTTFTLVLNIFGQSLTGTGNTLGTEKGTVLIKAGNGSNTQPFSFPNYNVYTPAIVTPSGPGLSNISVAPNPILPPQCATVTWDTVAGATVAISTVPNYTAQDCVIVNNADRSALVCLGNPDTYKLTITASLDGFNSTGTTTLVVSPPPLIETTCKQIRKTPRNINENPTCIYLCLDTIDGVKQTISSATWYNNSNCSGTGTPLVFYPKESTVKALVCAPCETVNVINGLPIEPGHPQACSENINTENPPFRSNWGGIARNCDVFQFEQQDQGFTAALGLDPWVVINGSMVWTRY